MTMIVENVDKALSLEKETYKVLKEQDTYILKRFFIKKKKLLYAFIGGMWYSKESFSLENSISLPYPFSTYYTIKILDKKFRDTHCRSLIYVKMPLLVLQLEDECIAIEFSPFITHNTQEIIPFISLQNKEDNYIVSFYLFNKYYLKVKEQAWLGIGKKKRFYFQLKIGNTFRFSTKVTKYGKWIEAVRSFAEKNIPKQIMIPDAEKVFETGKQALWRSYDHLTGSFLQLPWRDSPGFTFINSTYSLVAYEAIRLHYFTKWYKKTGDIQFLEWSSRLRNLFINPQLYKVKLKHGKGIIWYNMTNLTRRGLEGYFYMDCGYGGYPGGQATITYNLLQYLKYNKDKKVEELIKKSLRYIICTQNSNGSWPMALRQEGFIGFRPEKLYLNETDGGTAECVRALIEGYKWFKEDNILNSATNGLRFLESRYPICYNGLRDIGINEAEAFSAISIIGAYLDAYELTDDSKYLENALFYAYYTLTWFYFYNTKNLKLSYNFHPISQSITPRLSPYENLLIVSTYQRLADLTKDKIWTQYADAAYKETIKWISDNGGLCEGIFPIFLTGLQPLPMEQTFATVELLSAASNYFHLKKRIYKKTTVSNRNITYKKDGNILTVKYNERKILKFDVNKFKVVFLCGVKLNGYGISFSFFDSYSPKKTIVRVIKKYIRGKYGKFILGLSNLPYFFKGVYKPKIIKRIQIEPFEKHLKKTSNISIKKNAAYLHCETSLHKIECTLSVSKKDKKLHISFDPLVIRVLDHDVSSRQILFPVIGAKLQKKNNGKLFFDKFTVIGNFRRIVTGNDFTAVDQTLATNWTQGGEFKGGFEITLNIN